MTGRKRIAVIGAGYAGMSAAYDLAKAGHDVAVYEAESEIGGLAGTFEVSPGCRVEKFYHHWFSSDYAILDFIGELGLADRLLYKNSNTGIYRANSVFRLASPFDLLRFTPLPFIDRIRTGIMTLRARGVSDWRSLEGITAEAWLKELGGERGFEVIWKPLLQGKFGPEAPHISAVWFWNKLKLRGSSRDKRGKEQLAYFQGGFSAVSESLRQRLESAGVAVHLSSPVDRVIVDSGQVRGVRIRGTTVPADCVLGTAPLPILLDLVPELPASFVEPARKIRFLGNVCLVFRLRQSLSSTYWLNIADPEFPFVGVIEHTNFDDKANYGGEHIAYLSKYLPTSDPRFSMSDDEYYEYCVPYIQRIFPKFDRSWVIGHKTWRAQYSQPVITQHYSKMIPDIRTPIQGLWFSTMAQIYPEDRGTNYAVRHGRMVAREIIKTI